MLIAINNVRHTIKQSVDCNDCNVLTEIKQATTFCTYIRILFSYCCHENEHVNFQHFFFLIKMNKKRNTIVKREKAIKHWHAVLPHERWCLHYYSWLPDTCIVQQVCYVCLLCAFVTEWAIRDQWRLYTNNPEVVQPNKFLLFWFHNLELVVIDSVLWCEHPYLIQTLLNLSPLIR